VFVYKMQIAGIDGDGARGPVSGAEARPRVAILVVNGFDKRGHWGPYSRDEALRYPWIGLCLRQIERHSADWNYRLLVFDNSHLDRHVRLIEDCPAAELYPHPWIRSAGAALDRTRIRSLSRLAERSHPSALDYLVNRVGHGYEYVVTLDTDSFPVRDDWLDVLIGKCQRGALLSGVYRDEMAPTLSPFIHVSGCCARVSDLQLLRARGVSFARGIRQDVGQNITEALGDLGPVAPLRRSNRVNFHYLIGGLYGDVLYHHGAGSRKAKFWTSQDPAHEERVRVVLRDAAFADLGHLLEVLRGEVASDIPLSPVSTADAQRG
jgi:hypothetical protein